MKILVTGASGFVGGEVSRQAVAAGHDVAVLVRGDQTTGGARPLRGSLEAPPWAEICDFAPEVCIHCAWIATPGVYLESPENEVLVEASMALAGGLLECGLRHFIGAGTCFEYEASPTPLTIAAPPPTQLTPYSAAKIRLHGLLAGLFEVAPGPSPITSQALQDSCRFSWGRIFYAYGPAEHPNRFPSVLFRNFAEGKPVTVRRPHDIVDYIHISDIGSAFLRLAESGASGDFNVGSGKPTPVGLIAKIAARLTGREDLLDLHEHNDTTARVADLASWEGTRWQPLVNLEDGLRGMHDGRSQ